MEKRLDKIVLQSWKVVLNKQSSGQCSKLYKFANVDVKMKENEEEMKKQNELLKWIDTANRWSKKKKKSAYETICDQLQTKQHECKM